MKDISLRKMDACRLDLEDSLKISKWWSDDSGLGERGGGLEGGVVLE